MVKEFPLLVYPGGLPLGYHKCHAHSAVEAPTCKTCHSVITQTYRTFEKKTATLNVVFMHNLSGKVQLSFLFMRNLSFSLELFLFQKFITFFFKQVEPQARGGGGTHASIKVIHHVSHW